MLATPAGQYYLNAFSRTRFPNSLAREETEKCEAEVGAEAMKEAVRWAALQNIPRIGCIITAARSWGKKNGNGKASSYEAAKRKAVNKKCGEYSGLVAERSDVGWCFDDAWQHLTPDEQRRLSAAVPAGLHPIDADLERGAIWWSLSHEQGVLFRKEREGLIPPSGIDWVGLAITNCQGRAA